MDIVDLRASVLPCILAVMRCCACMKVSLCGGMDAKRWCFTCCQPACPGWRDVCDEVGQHFSRTLKSTQIRGVPKSDFSGSQKRGDKGGGEEGRSGGKVNRP